MDLQKVDILVWILRVFIEYRLTEIRANIFNIGLVKRTVGARRIQVQNGSPQMTSRFQDAAHECVSIYFYTQAGRIHSVMLSSYIRKNWENDKKKTAKIIMYLKWVS